MEKTGETIKMCDMSSEISTKVFEMLNPDKVTVTKTSHSSSYSRVIFINDEVHSSDLLYPEGWVERFGYFTNCGNATGSMYELAKIYEKGQLVNELSIYVLMRIYCFGRPQIMKRLGIEIKLENRETVIYMNGNRIEEKDLQSKQASIAVSKVSNIADNTKLYEFGKKLIDEYRKDYNIILSSRDIVKMYPDVTKHIFIDASIEERTNRKYMQYNKEIPKEQIKEMIQTRDELQEKSGYYKIYPQTKIIDVTNCKNAKESAKKVLENIKEVVKSGI